MLTFLEKLDALLAPLEGYGFAELSTLLEQAAEYQRTGVLPVAAGPKAKPRAAKPPAYDRHQVLADMTALRDAIHAQRHEFAAIEARRTALNKLSAADATWLGQQFGLSKAKTKAAAIEALIGHLKSINKTHDLGADG